MIDAFWFVTVYLFVFRMFSVRFVLFGNLSGHMLGVPEPTEAVEQPQSSFCTSGDYRRPKVRVNSNATYQLPNGHPKD